MLSTDTPRKFPIPWGADAGSPYIRTIPVASQIGIQNGAASLTDGFVPDNFLSTAGGGVPPFGQDMNGILKQVTQGLQWAEAGGGYVYDSDFSTSIAGYPKNAVLFSAVVPGKMWLSTVDGNTTDPDSSSAANWVTLPGQNPSGTPVPSFSSTVNPPGFVTANGQTIGDASSGATVASASMLFVFCAIWQQFSNSECPLLSSSGSPISRGANPFADFAAHCRLTTPSMRGTGIIGVDTMGGSATTLLSGVPVTIGNTTTPGSILGENLHTLTLAEIASHFHGATTADPGHVHTTNAFTFNNNTQTQVQSTFTVWYNQATATINSATTGVHVTSANGNNTTDSAGGGGSHNTVQRSMTVFWNLAL